MYQHKILFLGDSLSEWFDYTHYFPDKRILNQGIAGDTTSGVLHRLDDVFEAEPEKIFLMIGVNDIFHRIDKEHITRNHKKIINTLVDELPGSQLIVQSMLPINENMLFSMKLNNTISWLNKELNEYCLDLSLRFIDLFDRFSFKGQLKSEYTTDGGHLSSAGYTLWADLIRKYL